MKGVSTEVPERGRSHRRPAWARSGRRVAATTLAFVSACVALGACGSSSDGGGGASADKHVAITVWDGQTNISAADAAKIKANFERTHPNITVKLMPGSTGSGSILEKITAAMAANATPNISYVFGSNLAQVAQSPQVVDLTDVVQQPGWAFPDLFPAAQRGVTVEGKVKGVPVGMDDVAVFYNKKIFKQAGVPLPKPGWTWDDYRKTAKRLTDAGKGVYGTGLPGGGGSDTTWYTTPMIWQAGGDIVNADGTKVAFGDEPGLKTLQLLHDMAQVDKSVYVDTSPGYPKLLQLFTAGRVGMYLGDTWQFPGIKDAKLDYGVVPVPVWNRGDQPITQAGVQAWVVFDHGDAENKAAQEFLKWQSAPAQEAKWDATIGLPALGAAAQNTPTYQKFLKSTPGADVFNAQLASNTRTFPTIPTLDAILQELGKAEAAALLDGGTNLSHALQQAVDKANAAIATG